MGIIKRLFKRKTKLTPEEASDILAEMGKTNDPKQGQRILREGLKDKK